MAERVTPGQPLRTSPLRRAETVNRVLQVTDAFFGREIGGPSDVHRSRIEPDAVRVRNDSGGARVRGEVLQLGSLLLTGDFNSHAAWFAGGTPAEPALARFAIVRQQLPGGDIGLCQISGRCVCRVNVRRTDHTHAYPKKGEHVLTSDYGGPVELISALSATGVQDVWGIIDRSLSSFGIIRFQFTEDKPYGEDARAKQLDENNAQIGDEIGIVDRVGVWGPDPSDQKDSQDPAGRYGGWAARMPDNATVDIDGEVDAYELLWMEGLARFIEGPLLGDLDDGVATLSRSRYWGAPTNARPPQTTITVHDEEGFFEEAVADDLCRAIYDAESDKYRVAFCRTQKRYNEYTADFTGGTHTSDFNIAYDTELERHGNISHLAPESPGTPDGIVEIDVDRHLLVQVKLMLIIKNTSFTSQGGPDPEIQLRTNAAAPWQTMLASGGKVNAPDREEVVSVDFGAETTESETSEQQSLQTFCLFKPFAFSAGNQIRVRITDVTSTVKAAYFQVDESSHPADGCQLMLLEL